MVGGTTCARQALLRGLGALFARTIQHESQFTVTVWAPLTMLLRRACDVLLQREKDSTVKCPKYINYAILVLWHVVWADLSATLHHTNLWLHTVS